MESESLLELVRSALDLAERDPAPVSAVTRRAFRVARLRGDLEAVYWLSYELHPTGHKLSHGPIQREVLRHLSTDEASRLHERTLEKFLEGRGVLTLDLDGHPDPEPKVTGLSVAELEVQIGSLGRQAQEVGYDQEEMAYGSAVGLERTIRRQARWAETENRKVLTRILTRVHDWLSATEAELLMGRGHASIVQRNHEFVERELATVAPEAMVQLRNAGVFAMGSDPERWSLAGTSCRRALKSVADALYPPRAEPIVGADGRTRELNDPKWVNRLWQFIAERVSGEGAKATFRADLDALGATVESLNAVSSKGVHAELDSSEADLCVTRTYLLVGDLLRLHGGASGLDAIQTDRPDEEIERRTVDPTTGTA